MLNKIKTKLSNFMRGRYGVDQLGQALMWLSFIVLLPSIFITSNVRYIFNLLFWLIIFYEYFRMFSKNIYKRQAENNWYVNKVNYLKTRFKQRKTYRFYNCPKCKTHLRVPRGAGNITITCKKCGHQFDRKA
jgi:hypothetical protein